MVENRKSVILVVALIIIVIVCFSKITLIVKNKKQQNVSKNQIEIKTNRNTIDNLFSNFPESNRIYYTFKNLYSERSIGPGIYQIDILAELTDNAYNNFINQAEFEETEDFEININPDNIDYNWKKIKNIQIIESKDVEDASIRSIYLSEDTKTIYVIALGGN